MSLNIFIPYRYLTIVCRNYRAAVYCVTLSGLCNSISQERGSHYISRNGTVKGAAKAHIGTFPTVEGTINLFYGLLAQVTCGLNLAVKVVMLYIFKVLNGHHSLDRRKLPVRPTVVIGKAQFSTPLVDCYDNKYMGGMNP